MFEERITTHSLEVKGVILGGGRGTRLYPLTAENNKHLLPIGDKPLIIRVIDQLLEADVKDILLLVDERFASEFMEILKDGSHLGIRSLAYIWQSSEGKGLPAAIAQVEHFVRDGKIIVACGDVLVENGIVRPVSDFLKQEKGARMIAVRTEDTAGYSPLEVDEERAIKILPKDKSRHVPGLIDLGIYMYHADVFDKIRVLIPSSRGETEIWDLNEIYALKGDLTYSVVDGWWSDVGASIESYLDAHRRYEKK